jgi:hypothetical protein
VDPVPDPLLLKIFYVLKIEGSFSLILFHPKENSGCLREIRDADVSATVTYHLVDGFRRTVFLPPTEMDYIPVARIFVALLSPQESFFKFEAKQLSL